MKETFLKIYGEAHIRTLSPELIRKAFEKTGVFPFNLDVISLEIMAPSKETSLEGPLPLMSLSPICTAAASLRSILYQSSELDRHRGSSGQQVHNVSMDLINHTIHQLKDPKLRYLTCTSPIRATAQRPPVTTTTISPIKARYAHLLLTTPKMDQEKALMEMVHDLALREAHYKGVVAGLQCSVILQQAYVEHVHGQLESKEKKNQNQKGALRRGHAQLMTEDEAFSEIKLQTEERVQQKLEKERRKGMMEEHRFVMEEWKRSEEARKALNVAWHEE